MTEDFSALFKQRLSGQAEVCARKSLEWLQKDLQGEYKLLPSEVYYLASAANILLNIRDTYGKK
jgi:hypothetical protein